MASFYVIRGKDNGQHFAVRGANATIGREATNQIQLRDTEVSRKHARIIRTGDSHFEIIDNKSSNGTFVNGRRISSHALRSGDRVQLGRTLMIFTGGPDLQSTHAIDAVEIVNEGALSDVSQIRSSIEGLSQRDRGVSGIVVKAEEKLSQAANSDASSSPTSNLELVYQVSQAIHRTTDLDELLTRVLELIFHSVDCERGCILIVDEVSGVLRPVATQDRKQSGAPDGTANLPASKPLRISRTILEHVRTTEEGVLTSNAQDDERWQSSESVSELRVHEAICVPMLGRYGLVGAIYVDTSLSPGVFAEREAQNTFEPEQLKLMMAIAGQAALAIEDTQFYRAMVQAERLAVMGQTIANLSHHVKNILQGVSGGNYLVEDGLKRQDLEIVKKGWALVQKNQGRISNLVMDMLSFSKDREPELQVGDVCDLIDDVLSLLKTRAKEAGVTLRWQRPSESYLALYDSEGIHRALLNVVGNGVDATEGQESGIVGISVERKANLVRILVSDNGPGIPEEEQLRVFVPFESSKGAKGTGLGLPVSQKILREHGGDISLQSEVGQGTAFTLYWPAQQDTSGAPTLAGE